MSIPYVTWLGNVRAIVSALASREFQRDAWSGKVASSFGSPDEMMCVYFDDLLVPEFIGEFKEVVGAECALDEECLTELLRTFSWPMEDGFISADTLIEMPQWGEVCEAAKSFLALLPEENVPS